MKAPYKKKMIMPRDIRVILIVPLLACHLRNSQQKVTTGADRLIGQGGLLDHANLTWSGADNDEVILVKEGFAGIYIVPLSNTVFVERALWSIGRRERLLLYKRK